MMRIPKRFGRPDKKAVIHWLGVLLALVVGIGASEVARAYHLFLWADLRLYQAVSELGVRPLKPRHTVIVLIDDDAFWRGELAARIPLKRSYLAKLVESIATAGADVIALDIDFRSANPMGPARTHPDYEVETRGFLKVLETAARARPIVLTRPLGVNAANEAIANASIYDDRKPCDYVDSSSYQFYCGYLELPRDIRLLPPALLLADGSSLSSFAVATVQAHRRQGGDGDLDAHRRLRFGSYIPPERFHEYAVFPSGQILAVSAEERLRLLGGKIVLLGGAWSQLAYGRGLQVDLWDTPVGLIPGVFVQANYIEALLDDRVYLPLPHWLDRALEWGTLIVCVFAFELVRGGTRKALIIASLCAALLFAHYFALQNLGRIFDVFIPLLCLLGHAGYEQVSEWRRLALSNESKTA